MRVAVTGAKTNMQLSLLFGTVTRNGEVIGVSVSLVRNGEAIGVSVSFVRSEEVTGVWQDHS